jgi:hypothetical protein
MTKSTFAIFLSFLLSPLLHQSACAQLGRDVLQLFEAVGDSAGSMLGFQVTGLEDQNGDGYDDILVGAPGDRKAFIYWGGNPMDTIPDLTFYEENEKLFGYRLCNLGDVNGDLCTDFAIGSLELIRVYWGGAELDTLVDLILPTGRTCAAGDVNGDGYGDILHSDVTWESYQGKVSIYWGAPKPDSISDWLVVGDSAWCYFGKGIAGNEDVNGDGYDDIAISGWRSEKHGGSYTYIKMFYGGSEVDTIASFVIDELEHPLDISTTAVLIDVNGDGFSDLCVDSGVDTSAVLFYGPILPDIMPDLVMHGSSLSGEVWVISEAGDINGDGHADIITGNYDGWNNLGEVLVFLGGPYMDGEFDIGFSGFYGPYEGAGRSVGKAGDINGDGIDDILFGALPYFGDDKHGKVMIFSGDSTLTAVPSVPSNNSNQPHSFSLQQNYPNPFNESTIIEYEISVVRPAKAVLKIYNILGEEVVTLIDTCQNSGFYRVTWDGKDKFGTDVGSGIYLCLLQVGNYRQAMKLLLIR